MPRRRSSFAGQLRPGNRSLLSAKAPLILEAVRNGQRLSAAAKAAGVSERTVEEWLQRGRGILSHRSATPAYKQFVVEVERAFADAEIAAVDAIRQTMARDYRAAHLWLQANVPEVWGPRALTRTLPAPEPVAPPKDTNVILISPEHLARLGREILDAHALASGESDADYLDELISGPEDLS